MKNEEEGPCTSNTTLSEVVPPAHVYIPKTATEKKNIQNV